MLNYHYKSWLYDTVDLAMSSAMKSVAKEEDDKIFYLLNKQVEYADCDMIDRDGNFRRSEFSKKKRD